ncbi:MAG: hypothetical protein Q8N82_05880 [Deltaproteobacteria bacterium]|nr:hypothetical protein [Deltaproteobacteria bacterium]
MFGGKKKAKVIQQDQEKILKKKFEILKKEVPIYVFTREGENDPFNRFTVALIKDLGNLTPKIIPEFHEVGDEVSKKYDVSRSPTILIDPEAYHIRYTGSPAGEEMRSFLDTIVMTSVGKTLLSSSDRERLAALKDGRHIQVFVTPT